MRERLCSQESDVSAVQKLFGNPAVSEPIDPVSVSGTPRRNCVVQWTFTLRATQVYRREDGQWKAARRHADTVSPAA